MFEAEGEILAAHGHAVERLEFDNHDVEGMGRAALAARTVWSREGRDAVERAARAHQADVVHFHNTLPLVSPAGYYGARAAGAAVVQTLHNYRLICPGALLYRDGTPCEDCVGRAFAWPAVLHGCYRGSRAATLAVATMTTVHRALGTWTQAVDRYIAITPFAYGKFVAGGLPTDKLAVKANPMAFDPGAGENRTGRAVFVGRLDQGKGVEPLLRAWREHPDLPPLTIVGDGPLAPVVEAAASGDGRIEWTGWRSRSDVLAILQSAAALVFPSVLFEGGTPMTLVEAFACGLPVAASDLGSARDVVDGDRLGRRFTPGDPAALADAVRAVVHAPDYDAMRLAVRDRFLQTYAPDPNYAVLARIYRDALAERHADDRRPWTR